ASLRQQRNVARELDRIAQSLLGVQQNRPSPQRIFSEPERTAAAMPRHVRSPPSPFVFLKAAPKVPDGQQRQRLIEMRVGVVLLQFERLGVARQRLIEAIERLQREP